MLPNKTEKPLSIQEIAENQNNIWQYVKNLQEQIKALNAITQNQGKLIENQRKLIYVLSGKETLFDKGGDV